MAVTHAGMAEIAEVAERAAVMARRGIFYGWYIVAAGAGTNFIVIGLVTFSFSVFIGPIRDELGWSVAAISLGVSLRSFEQGLLAPVTGVLIDRLGPRRMAITGIIFTSIGLVVFSQAHSLEMYYASSLLLAFGQSLGSLQPFSAALMFWFQRKRGRAMGLLNTGNGAGYLMTPGVAILVTQVGWRETLLMAAVLVFFAGIPLAMVLRNRPEPYGYVADGDVPTTEGPTVAPEASGMTVGEGLRTPAFYLLSVSTALSGGLIIAWIVHQVPHLESVGFSLSGAAALAGVYGACQLALRPIVGWLGDRFGRLRLYSSAFVMQGVGLIIFANLTPDRLWLLPFYYAAFAFGNSTWIVLQMALIADYFGPRRFATLRGFASTLNMPMGIISPFLAGYIFDQTGSYRDIFMIYAVLVMTGSIMVLMIRRPFWTDVLRQREEAAAAARAAQGAGPSPGRIQSRP